MVSNYTAHKKGPGIHRSPALIFMATDRRSCCNPVEFFLYLPFAFTYRVGNFVFEIDNAALSFFIGSNFQNVFSVNDNINELLPKQSECTFLYHVLLDEKKLMLMQFH